MTSTVNNKFLESYFPKVISEIKGFAVFMMDTNGIICTWNKGCEDLKGFSSEDAIGKNYISLFPGFLDIKEMPLKQLHEAAEKGRYETEDWRIKKSGELFWAYIVLTKVTDNNGNHIGFCKIMQDYSTKKKYEMELKQKNEMLIATNFDLDNFVYTASHDLKAPLNNLQGLISNLEDILIHPQTESESLDTLIIFIKDSIKRFKSVITEMATIGVTQAEEEQKKSQSFNEVIEEVIKSLADEILQAQVQIEEELWEPLINFSRKNLRCIIYNLVSNAIKYRFPNRKLEIKITTKKEKKYIVISVSDNGVGIKEEDKKKVFSLYQRLDNAANYVEGTGVGMAIVARIVARNAGKIQIDSEPGIGTTFNIYLKSLKIN
ncbi:MAG: PAS domain-containing sensor histidine kinase [Opitutaceae bacterium]|nr:PAS domain-containing sensor histidine kinase [Cytophagales bacterium]